MYHLMGNNIDISNPCLMNVLNIKSKNGSLLPIFSQFDHDYDGEEDAMRPMPMKVVGIGRVAPSFQS
jgi:hypothetical protein